MMPKIHYSEEEICELLEKAKELGYPLGPGSWVENLTIAELDVLVNRKLA